MKGPFDDMDFAREEVAKCMSCGNCQEVCPVYLETKEEGSVARGKIKLVEALLNDVISADTPGLEHHLSYCLTCKACNEVCPCGVEIDKIILAARAEVVRERGLHPLKKVIFNVVDRPRLFDTGMRLGGAFQGLIFKREEKLSGQKPRFPIGLDQKRMLPTLPARSFRHRVAAEHKVADVPRYRVAFFTGCATNYMYPHVGDALLKILARHQVEVYIPEKQHCCGMPILSHGDAKTAREMAADHVRLFRDMDVDYIITVCGSCALSFKEHYPDLLAGQDLYDDALRVADKVMDWSEFLVHVLEADFSALSVKPQVVTYHDPCHLRRGIGVSEAPREILRRLPGVTFVEMQRPNRCCGSAGSFSITHYDLSMDIQKKKFEDIAGTGAETVVTGCGSCVMQLRDGQQRFNGHCEPVHLAEFVAAAYDGQA